MFAELANSQPGARSSGIDNVTSYSRLWQNRWTMRLLNGERADLVMKLEDYALNPHHREGRHEARRFESVLGITQTNREVLRHAILVAAGDSDQAEGPGDNGHGEVDVLRFSLESESGRATVLTAGIIRHGEDFPRLTTCYIL